VQGGQLEAEELSKRAQQAVKHKLATETEAPNEKVGYSLRQQTTVVGAETHCFEWIDNVFRLVADKLLHHRSLLANIEVHMACQRCPGFCSNTGYTQLVGGDNQDLPDGFPATVFPQCLLRDTSSVGDQAFVTEITSNSRMRVAQQSGQQMRPSFCLHTVVEPIPAYLGLH